MANSTIIAFYFISVFTVTSTISNAQYLISPYPDIWYNDIDGIRVGLRLIGEVDGSFKDGPHRLDAGIWLGSKTPEHPISYFLSFTEPLAKLSRFGSEGSIQIITSSRTGYAKHQLSFIKRWQRGFNELEYLEVSLYGSYEKNFDANYRLNPANWSSKWKSLLGTIFNYSSSTERTAIKAELSILRELNTAYNVLSFNLANGVFLTEDTSLNTRLFYHKSGKHAFGEYMPNIWTSSEINWQENGFQRAEGTIPSAWINDGILHVVGGANLRGYVNQFSKYEVVYGLNLELSFINFIQHKINSSIYFSDILKFKRYLFFDIGAGDNEMFFSNSEINPTGLEASDTGLLSDAGLGFQLSANIPDYLGKDRGLFIRYDIPFWLSSPSNHENNFRYRSVVGIGAIFNF